MTLAEVMPWLRVCEAGDRPADADSSDWVLQSVFHGYPMDSGATARLGEWRDVDFVRFKIVDRLTSNERKRAKRNTGGRLFMSLVHACDMLLFWAANFGQDDLENKRHWRIHNVKTGETITVPQLCALAGFMLPLYDAPTRQQFANS